MSDRSVARRVSVAGRVQGVFFRDSARREAERLGVAGWARNCSDGTVEGHLEGPPDAVDAVVQWFRSGPPRARVDRVEVEEVAPEGLRDFTIC